MTTTRTIWTSSPRSAKWSNNCRRQCHKSLIEGALDACPVFNRILLPWRDRDDELIPAGAAQRFNPLLQFLLGCREGRMANQIGGDEFPLFGLHKYKMPAVVVEVACIRRLVVARHLHI